jgi:hypothetical protein
MITARLRGITPPPLLLPRRLPAISPPCVFDGNACQPAYRLLEKGSRKKDCSSLPGPEDQRPSEVSMRAITTTSSSPRDVIPNP